jgi:ABC-2 type transport system ATP-binding protein
LLDEPLAGIDPASREKIATGLLKSLAGERRTVLIASHLVDEIEQLLGWVIFLEAGKIVLQGEAPEGALRRLSGPNHEEGASVHHLKILFFKEKS